jgi:hypothetical protein
LIREAVAKNFKLKVEPSDQTISGVGSCNKACLGEVICDVRVGRNTLWPQVKLYVVDDTMISLDGIFGRNPMNQRCSEIAYNTLSKTLFFKNKSGWARVPYISAPSRDTFDAKNEEHKVLNLSKGTDQLAYIQRIKEELGPDINTTNVSQAYQIARLMRKHQMVFCSEDRPIGQFTEYRASIPTIEGRSAFMHQYKLPIKYEDKVTDEVQRLKKMGVLTKCKNNLGFNTPLGCVPKSDGKARLILNFKNTVNRILTEEDTFCVPDLQSESMLNPNMKYLATLDIRAGYWNIPIKKEHQHKFSVMWKSENLQFTRLPFGLKTSGSIFSRALAHSLETVKHKNCLKIYIDDLLVFSDDFKIFHDTIDQVLACLNTFGFVVAGNKVFALHERVKWLGRIITPQGTIADPGNANAFRKMEAPKTYKGLQSLLGAMNWLRMYAAAREDENVGSKSFSHVIKPISALLKTNKPGQKLAWTRDADHALQVIKERLTSETMIFHPDWSLPFTLTSDASKYAMGYALTQCVGGRTRIVRVNSKTLNDAQTRYSATEREALGV